MFRIDLHVHSTLGGDSLIHPEDLVLHAKKAGLDAVCITEHHSWGLSAPFDDISRATGFPILRGLEYRAAEGHLLIYGVRAGKGDLLPGLPLQTAIDWVCDRGGIAVPAHPFQKTMAGTALGNGIFSLKNITAIETINASVPDAENQAAMAAAKKMRISGIGGSDAHGLHVLGKACTLFPTPILSDKDLVCALKAGDYRPVSKEMLMKAPSTNIAFWRHKPLRQMTSEQWEAICAGCGLCCLYKLQHEDTDEIVYTWVSCRLLDTHHCRCLDYSNRNAAKKECVPMTPENLETMYWLPETCGYRLLLEGKDLPPWHPLVSGDPETVHSAGFSLRNKAIPEDYIDPDDLELYLIDN